MSEGGSLVSDSSNFNKDSIQNVIVIALVVCLFCAIVVAGSAVALKERRVENKALDKSKNVLIAAHGNSLRALIKYLDGVSEEDILGMNVPTGMPLVYELDENLKPVSRQYLGDPDKVAKAMEAVANQGKAK